MSSTTDNRIYICIDLKSFYASVECASRGLNPMTTKLVVADPERGGGTICLAVSPALKALGVKNRCRVFEIPDSIEYIKAVPRMQLYIDYSVAIYRTYLRYFSPDDMQVYSIDEVFIDITDYLNLYHTTPRGMAAILMGDVLSGLGIPSACGIGTNLYLAKIALDITAKHAPDRIGYLDEESYKRLLWHHLPLTDFWRIGRGTERRLSSIGITNMEELATANEKLLYKMFGVDAELLIDHAWGREFATIESIKSYKPKTKSLSKGQVLLRDYSYDEALIILKEMVDLLALSLVDHLLITDSISLYVGYSKDTFPPVCTSIKLSRPTSSSRVLAGHFTDMYENMVNQFEYIRRINISFNNLVDEAFFQYDLFTTPEIADSERNLQRSINTIHKRYGGNSLLKASSLLDASTIIERNRQIGGHKA